MDASQPPSDDELAESLVGKYILVGITYLDPAGAAVRREQVHGVIESASRDGLCISLRGERDGERWRLPTNLRAIRPAERGVYSLHSTGEEVENPDLLSTWRVRDAVTLH